MYVFYRYNVSDIIYCTVSCISESKTDRNECEKSEVRIVVNFMGRWERESEKGWSCCNLLSSIFSWDLEHTCIYAQHDFQVTCYRTQTVESTLWEFNALTSMPSVGPPFKYFKVYFIHDREHVCMHEREREREITLWSPSTILQHIRAHSLTHMPRKSQAAWMAELALG